MGFLQLNFTKNVFTVCCILKRQTRIPHVFLLHWKISKIVFEDYIDLNTQSSSQILKENQVRHVWLKSPSNECTYM
jgi:hypothetical protein